MIYSKVGILLLLTSACSSSALVPLAHDSGAPETGTHDSGLHDSGAHDSGMPPMTPLDSGTDAQPVNVCGAMLGPGQVPAAHRSVPGGCGPSLVWPGGPDPTKISCTTTNDCRGDGGSPFFTCLNGHCSNDECLTDADCGPTGACSCARSSIQHNLCGPANCHVDSDCGPGGYCSPTTTGLGACGPTGLYCHTPNDTCFDATRDCTSCGIAAPACVYSPASGTFVCGDSRCPSSG